MTLYHHELTKLDTYLNVECGTTFHAIVRHKPNDAFIAALLRENIKLTNNGLVIKESLVDWKNLMIKLGISNKYWKDKNDLQNQDNVITDL